jgi:hypothetical protein
VRQEIRFCSALDGTRLAYAVHGRGAPLVRTATWLTHLELDWQSPVWRHLSVRTVERHLSNIYAKLRVSGKAARAAAAARFSRSLESPLVRG